MLFLTRIAPRSFMFPSQSMSMVVFTAFKANGVIGSDSVTSFGTVSIIRVKSDEHFEAKAAGDWARLYNKS